MRDRATSAIAIAGMIIVAERVWAQEARETVLGIGPETFDWSAGLHSIFGFLFSFPMLAVVVIGAVVVLVRRIGSPRGHSIPSGRKPSMPGGA